MQLFSDMTIHNVLYVPSFKYNLLSVYRFSNQFNYTIFFNSDYCLLQGPLLKRPQLFGEEREGLYLLQQSIPKQPSASQNLFLESHTNSSISSSVSFPNSISISFPVCSNVSSDVRLWHVRLGHMPYSSMTNVSFLSIPSHFNCHCDVCPRARQSRLPFPISQITSKANFDLIHIDTWGPYKVPTYNSYR